MAQFHVYRVPGGRLVLDLQTDLIETGTRVVAPLLPAASPASRPAVGPEPFTAPEGVSLPPFVSGFVDRFLSHAGMIESSAMPSSRVADASSGPGCLTGLERTFPAQAARPAIRIAA